MELHGIKVPPLHVTVPGRQGQNVAFMDLKLRKMPFFSTKNVLSPPLTVPLQPAMRKVHGDNFPDPSSPSGPKCDRINAPLRY